MNEQTDKTSETSENPESIDQPLPSESVSEETEKNPAAKSEAEDSKGNIEVDFLNDVPMRVTVELGVGDITIRDLLQLGQGSVLELEKLAGEPLEVKLNDRLVSRGEVVTINDRFGIRLTDVISPDDFI